LVSSKKWILKSKLFARLCCQIGLKYMPIRAKGSQGWGMIGLGGLLEATMSL